MPRSVLVVDDEANILLSLEFLMKKAGYDVRTARDREEALAEMQKARPDLVLLDVMMPKRNGFDVCEIIRANPEWKDVRIIMLTAKGATWSAKRAWRSAPTITSPNRSRPGRWSSASADGSTVRATRKSVPVESEFALFDLV